MPFSFPTTLLSQQQQACGQVPMMAVAVPGASLEHYKGYGRALRAYGRALRTYGSTSRKSGTGLRTSATTSRGYGSRYRGFGRGYRKYGSTARRYGSPERGFGNCSRAKAHAHGDRAPPHRSDSALPQVRTRYNASGARGQNLTLRSCFTHRRRAIMAPAMVEIRCPIYSPFHSFKSLTNRNHG